MSTHSLMSCGFFSRSHIVDIDRESLVTSEEARNMVEMGLGQISDAGLRRILAASDDEIVMNGEYFQVHGSKIKL